MKLNLGCGDAVMDGYVNVDRVAYSGVDLVLDLEVELWPWPWSEGEVDEIVACQLFEHLADPVDFMRRCWLALTTGGTLVIVVPHYQSRNAFTDPTHRRFCTEETFDYWLPDRPLFRHNLSMGGFAFTSGVVEHVGDDIHALLVK